MIFVYILIVLDFIVLLFSRILSRFFDVNIISVWLPAIPYLIFFLLILFVLIRWDYKKHHKNRKKLEKFSILIVILLLSIIPYIMGIMCLGIDSSFFSDVKTESYKIDNEIIIYRQSDAGVWAFKQVIIGEPLILGLMTVENVYTEENDLQMFDYYYQKIGNKLDYDYSLWESQ